MKRSPELHEELRKTYLFTELDDGQLLAVMETMRARHLDDRERLFDRGAPARHFYLVRSGQIRLFRLSSEGDDKTIEIIRPGQTFAEAVMFMEKQEYPVHAEAVGATGLLEFDMRTVQELLRSSVDTCFRLMATMSQRLHARLNDIENLVLQNATYRLVSFLLQQLPPGVAESPAVHLTTPKTVIASRLSIQPETLSRILARLGRLGLIDVHGNTIMLRDIDGLRRLIHESMH